MVGCQQVQTRSPGTFASVLERVTRLASTAAIRAKLESTQKKHLYTDGGQRICPWSSVISMASSAGSGKGAAIGALVGAAATTEDLPLAIGTYQYRQSRQRWVSH